MLRLKTNPISRLKADTEEGKTTQGPGLLEDWIWKGEKLLLEIIIRLLRINKYLSQSATMVFS